MQAYHLKAKNVSSFVLARHFKEGIHFLPTIDYLPDLYTLDDGHELSELVVFENPNHVKLFDNSPVLKSEDVSSLHLPLEGICYFSSGYNNSLYVCEFSRRDTISTYHYLTAKNSHLWKAQSLSVTYKRNNRHIQNVWMHRHDVVTVPEHCSFSEKQFFETFSDLYTIVNQHGKDYAFFKAIDVVKKTIFSNIQK